MHLALNYKGKPYIGVVLSHQRMNYGLQLGVKFGVRKEKITLLKNICLKAKKFNEMVLVTSKNHKNDNLNRLIEKINFKKVINMGSIGCKIASIIKR